MQAQVPAQETCVWDIHINRSQLSNIITLGTAWNTSEHHEPTAATICMVLTWMGDHSSSTHAMINVYTILTN
jgi:hypothetical protein